MKKTIHIIFRRQDNLTDAEYKIFEGVTEEAQRKKCLIKVMDLHRDTMEEIADSVGKCGGAIAVGMSWVGVGKLVECFKSKEINPVFAGLPVKETAEVSRVFYDVKAAGEEMTKHLLRTRNRIAFIGLNRKAYADLFLLRGFMQALNKAGIKVKRENIFLNYGNLKDCINQFISNIQNFDAVFCVNDIVAVALMRECGLSGITVPDDIAVSGFGNTNIGRFISPTLTTVAPRYKDVGKSAVDLVSIMKNSPHFLQLDIKCGHDIIIRESSVTLNKNKDGTCNTEKVETVFEPVQDLEDIYSSWDEFYEDRVVNSIVKIEKQLLKSDDIDIKILGAVMKNSPYHVIAEELYIAENTVKYRIGRMLKKLECESIRELYELVDKSIGHNMLRL